MVRGSGATWATAESRASLCAATGFAGLESTTTSNPPLTFCVAVSTCAPIMCEIEVMKVRMKTTSAYMATVSPVRERRASG